MSVERTRAVDAIGIDRETGEVVMSLLDGHDWDDEASHLEQLLAKLDAYFAFLEGGELSTSYPQGVGRDVRIDVIFRVQPPYAAQALLGEASRCAAEAGVGFAWRVSQGASQ